LLKGNFIAILNNFTLRRLKNDVTYNTADQQIQNQAKHKDVARNRIIVVGGLSLHIIEHQEQDCLCRDDHNVHHYYRLFHLDLVVVLVNLVHDLVNLVDSAYHQCQSYQVGQKLDHGDIVIQSDTDLVPFIEFI
jgi:hypothetical protein